MSSGSSGGQQLRGGPGVLLVSFRGDLPFRDSDHDGFWFELVLIACDRG
jgi:hypothetical protein